MKNTVKFFLSSCFIIFFSCSFSQAEEAPLVGREAAAKYFQRKPSQDLLTGSSDEHYLALHLGRFMNSSAWDWGSTTRENATGGMSTGVTYRLSEQWETMDFGIRIDFNEYKIADEKPLKMSLMPVYLFPEADSKFPLYFGAAAGLGVFFKQIDGESPLSFDYQLIMGARFFNLYENTGFFVETGMKNHLLLTSSGQFNGTYLTAGALFTF